jgi:hypothetical protein
VLDLAENDPDALSSSLVLTYDEEYPLDKKGRPITRDDDGNDVTPTWRPKQLHASDIVDTGDAVDGLLSADGLPDALVRHGCSLLDLAFAGQTEEVIRERALAWLTRYLEMRFPGHALTHHSPLTTHDPPLLDLYRRRYSRMLAAFVHNSKLADREPDWASIDKTKLPRLAFAGQGEEGKKSTWSYPHHWVSGGTKLDDDGIWDDGTLYLHKGGLDAAWSAAQGARSGEKAPQAVIDHLQMHRKALGLEPG